MKSVLAWFPFLAFFALAQTLAASPPETAPPGFRVAIVDVAKVFSEHPATREATRELTEARETLMAEFKEASKELKTLLQDHQEAIRAGDRDEAETILKEANEVEKRIASLKTTQQRDLDAKFRAAKSGILAEVRSLIARFNAEGQYGLILDSSASSPSGAPQVVHAPAAEDITEAVIALLEEEFEPESEKP